MSLYLHLSCGHGAHWLLPSVLLLSILASLSSWLFCHLQAPPASYQCMTRTIHRTCQVLIGLTLIAYFNLLADLFTQKMRRLVVVAETEGGMAQIRERLRALLSRCGNNSVSPVEEINLNGNTQFSTGTENDQNQNGLKDHIRSYVETPK